MPGERFGGDKKLDCKDHISPYKIAILIVLKEHSKFIESMQDNDACTLILNVHRLIQIPDMDLVGLFKELKNISSFQFMEAIKSSLHQLCNGTVHLLHELMDEAPGLLLYTPMRSVPNENAGHANINESFLHKGSVLGIFIRRMALSFEKMAFHEICELHTSLCTTYRKTFPPKPAEVVEFGMTSSRPGRTGFSDWPMENGDISERGFGVSTNRTLAEDEDEDEDEDEYTMSSKKYSHKQANYFVAQQANLLNFNECEALPPKELHSKIGELLKCHPNFPEAHFLKYMNYLRVRECKASLDSLFSYFDRVFNVAGDSRSKVEDADSSGHHGYRYAALNVAAMAYRFGHRDEAMSAILECIKISQQNNDSVCLQHALSWLHRLEMPEEGNPLHMLERLIASSNEYNLPELASMGCLSYAKQSYLIGAQPSLVFENMMASDVINSDHNLPELSCGGFAQKSSLWNLYGYDNLNKMNNFLILNTTSKESQLQHNGEPHCLALCHIARTISDTGDFDSSIEIIKFLRNKFPQMSTLSHLWILCNQQIRFQMTLLQGNFNLSDRAIREMSAVNGLEGSYSRCVYLAETGELGRSLELADMIIDRCKVKTNGVIQTNNLLIRCLLHKCKICCSLEDPTAAIQSVVEASMLSKEKNFSHMTFMVLAHVALLQMKMEMYETSLSLLTSILSDVLNSSSTIDQARVLFLYVRSWLAYSNSDHCRDNKAATCHTDYSQGDLSNLVNTLGGASSKDPMSGLCNGSHGGHGKQTTSSMPADAKKKLIMKEMLPIMDEVCHKFRKVKAHHRLKDALYFQAMMYNDLGMVKERNRTSLQHNQVESQLVNSPSTIKFCSPIF